MSQNNSQENKSQTKLFFTFTIENFIDLNEEYIKSSDFNIGDTKWYAKVFPRKIEDNIEYISVFLYLSESDRYVNEATYRVSIIKNNNQLSNKRNTKVNDYTPNGEGWGLQQYIRRDQLTEDLMPNNELKLRFEIDLFDSDLKHENRITYDLKNLVNNNKYSDFVFIVDNKEFFAHKCILSVRSKVFEAMFSNDMIESQSNRCTIDDIESEVFKELLTFIYTGKAPKAQTMVEKLLAAAEKYEILEIKDFCANIIFKDIKNENAIQNLIIADKYNATKLLDKIIEFIADNFQSILNISVIEWEKFLVENPKLVTKVFKTMAEKRQPISGQ
jgi:speckle-type POZ protein